MFNSAVWKLAIAAPSVMGVLVSFDTIPGGLPLFKGMRRSLQVPQGDRPRMVATDLRRPMISWGRDHEISKRGGRVMNLLFRAPPVEQLCCPLATPTTRIA